MRTVGFFVGALSLLSSIYSSAVPTESTFFCAAPEEFEPRLEAAAKPAQRQPRPLPSRGHISVLVIFAQFQDEAIQVPDYADTLFEPGRVGSFTHFYHTMSFGQLQVQGTVLPKRYTSDQSAAAYLADKPDEKGHYGPFVGEILQKVDADYDLGQFDNDGPDGVPNSGDDDGIVDYIFINVRSMPRNFLIGGATGIAGLGLETDYKAADTSFKGPPIRIAGSRYRGALQQEGTFAQTVGTMAHEFGHGLGLPDLYDTSLQDTPTQPPSEDSAGIGLWGLMGWGALGWHGDDGPNPLCAWSREQLGWIGPDNERLVEIRKDTTGAVLPDVHQQGFIYKIPLQIELFPFEGGKRVRYVEDYLLLEQRLRSAHYYNRNQPSDGLLIWHIRSKGSNTHEANKRVDLVCADGLYREASTGRGRMPDPYQGRDHLDFWAHDTTYADVHGGNLGDATDLFDGIRYTRFAMDSNPSTAIGGRPSAAYTSLALEIHQQGESMRVDIRWPYWSGTIAEEVHWIGDIRVDGDLTIAPQGQLVIYPTTRVRVAATDRLQQGLDPARCEIQVQGTLGIYQGRLYRWPSGATVEPTPVVFETGVPGRSWYGILPEASAQVQVPEGSLIIRDAAYGLLVPNVAPVMPLPEPATAISTNPMSQPVVFQLRPNYPNPFNTETTIRYGLPVVSPVRLVIYNGLGQKVRTLVEDLRPAGIQTVVWDGRDDRGQELASGSYLYHLQAGSQVEKRKLLLIR